MKFNVHIDFETPKWLGRIVAYAVPVIVLLGAGAWVFASPQPFLPGDPLTAAHLQSLNVVDGGVNNKYSVGATTYCGSTGTTAGAITSGGFSGYAAAKRLCEAVGNPCSATAHMCTANEIGRSKQLGMTVPPGWNMSAFAQVTAPGTSVVQFVTDCKGWTSASSGDWGPSWDLLFATVSTGPGYQRCDNTQVVLCCD